MIKFKHTTDTTAAWVARPIRPAQRAGWLAAVGRQREAPGRTWAHVAVQHGADGALKNIFDMETLAEPLPGPMPRGALTHTRGNRS